MKNLWILEVVGWGAGDTEKNKGQRGNENGRKNKTKTQKSASSTSDEKLFQTKQEKGKRYTLKKYTVQDHRKMAA